MAQPLVSVLLPTRGRPHLLRRSVSTLLDLATSPADVEICYAVDTDDDETYATVRTLLADRLDIVWVSPTSHGYGGFEVYANELSTRATGTWLLLWNDDALMETFGWDEVVRSYDPRWVLSPRCNHAEGIVAFPIVPRLFVETLGHFSLNPHNDTWWQYLADITHTLTWVDIDIIHDRFDLTGHNNDETYRRTRQQSLNEQTAHRFWTEAIQLIEKDRQILTDLLQWLGDVREDARDG